MAIFFTLWQQHILIRDLPSKMVYFEMTKDFKSENVGNNFFYVQRISYADEGMSTQACDRFGKLELPVITTKLVKVFVAHY